MFTKLRIQYLLERRSGIVKYSLDRNYYRFNILADGIVRIRHLCLETIESLLPLECDITAALGGVASATCLNFGSNAFRFLLSLCCVAFFLASVSPGERE